MTTGTDLIAESDRIVAEYDRVRARLDVELRRADELLARYACLICGNPSDSTECNRCFLAEDVAAIRREDV